MSQPPQPPNNPYAQNPYQQQPQSPYGQYPGQAQQPAYGYPQAPPPGPGGLGATPPGVIPGQVNGARIMMFIAGGLQALVSIGCMIALGVAADRLKEVGSFAEADTPIAVMYIVCGVLLVHAVVGIVLGTSVSKGGNGVRVGGIVWASFLTLFGLPLIPLGLLWMGLGITCIVMLAQAGAWFNRPRY
ncbi:hypothetical protein [Streptomyces albidus (ex Kaewkla and Franco 2022)]|uniref:hypothetical protein n=1 Tax=Streptomyces albidus (ex Kaewkla and Franco 2022) TaxID=722709 RepID=UPI0015EF41D7|nr:hypothetical protein [Streptomyces albidus (ex Kaewkla and Franco 2022)]